MAAKAYLEKYIDCVDSMPLDVQRIVSQLRELDRQTQQLLPQLHRAREQCERLRDQPSAGSIEQQQWASQLHQLMVSVRHMGNEKLELTSEMMDIVEDYTHQLALREKDMDNCRTREDANNLRLSSFASHPHKITSSPLSAIEGSSEKKKIDRAHKRSRMSSGMGVSASIQHDDDSPPPPPPPPPPIRDPPSKAREGSSASTGAVNSSSRPPKKKAKLKKSRSSSKDSSAASAYHSTSHIPTPDFSTEPIDPDEPTYCLCQQVSFGEMIGCDNDNCQIEWFHFQCVGLTSKPKGKWYCPQCSNERSKHRTTK